MWKGIIGLIALIIIAAAGVWYMHKPQVASVDRLAECGAYPNGSTQNIKDTTRLFINLPKEIYPDLSIEGKNATADYISNGGPEGSAMGAQGKPNCSSTYYEFDLAAGAATGTVDIYATSTEVNIPNYSVHFVVSSTASTTTSAEKGTITGTVMLGPTCPVERNPPDPQCADKKYSTLVAIFKASDPVHAVVLTRSDAAGNFSASLPPGSYVVGAGESNLPRCSHENATVTANKTTNISVFCDTGIR
jgi:hypothetical protein